MQRSFHNPNLCLNGLLVFRMIWYQQRWITGSRHYRCDTQVDLSDCLGIIIMTPVYSVCCEIRHVEVKQLFSAVNLCIFQCTWTQFLLPSSRHHLSYADCLEDNRENYQNCSLLCCVWQLCTMICTHMWAVLKDECWFRFRFSFCAFV